jgi:hypothetical protein
MNSSSSTMSTSPLLAPIAFETLDKKVLDFDRLDDKVLRPKLKAEQTRTGIDRGPCSSIVLVERPLCHPADTRLRVACEPVICRSNGEPIQSTGMPLEHSGPSNRVATGLARTTLNTNLIYRFTMTRRQ